MPTYEYRCPDGHAFEVFQKMSDDPVARCPECGAKAERLISGGAGFLFRGDGFYITDYRSADYKEKASKETASLDSGTSGSDAGKGGSSAGSKASTSGSEPAAPPATGGATSG